MELAAGGIQQVLLQLCDSRPHQRPAVAFDEVLQGVPDVFVGQRFVVVAEPDEFTTERPEFVAMAASGCLCQALIQQVQQERCEHFNDLLAHGDIRRIDPLL